MKETLRKNGALFLVLLIVTGVCLLFSCRKSGMFIDEIYTYGLSNSHFAPFLTDVAGGALDDSLVTRQDLLDYVTVNEGEALDFASVYYNQVNDVHPPLYYWLFNLASSLTPEVFSKWTGLALDYLIYLAALLLLYRLALLLTGSRLNAAVAVALYGLSGMGLSTMLYIRMYVLITALTVWLALLIARLMREPRPLLYPLIGLCIFLGLMTQYYFVFYAFFLCASYVFWALSKKRWRSAVLFAVCAFIGVALLPLCFPACLDHLFADKLVSGGNAMENLRDPSQYAFRLTTFVGFVRHGTRAAIFTALAGIAALLPCWKKLRAAGKAGVLSAQALVLILPAFVTLVLVALISPVLEPRYVYNLAPIFILAVCWLLSLLEQSLGDLPHAKRWKSLAALLILALALWEARTYPPDYLYPEYRDYDALIAAHADEPCVYLDDGYFSPLTQDLQQLLLFEDLFVTADPDSAALDDYLAAYPEAGACVVYVDTNAYWSSGFRPEEMLPRVLDSTDFQDYVPLYENQLSAAYLLTK